MLYFKWSPPPERVKHATHMVCFVNLSDSSDELSINTQCSSSISIPCAFLFITYHWSLLFLSKKKFESMRFFFYFLPEDYFVNRDGRFFTTSHQFLQYNLIICFVTDILKKKGLLYASKHKKKMQIWTSYSDSKTGPFVFPVSIFFCPKWIMTLVSSVSHKKSHENQLCLKCV